MSAISYIAANLRDRDAIELRALFGPRVDVTTRLADIAVMPGIADVVWWRDQPIFVFGVLLPPATPQLGYAWGFGTDQAWRAIPAAGREVKSLSLRLIADGVRRVEVRVLAENRSSVHWLTNHLGAEFETELHQFGANGETFLQFAWTIKGNNKNVLSNATGAHSNTGTTEN
jgi:hypothetical protein